MPCKRFFAACTNVSLQSIRAIRVYPRPEKPTFVDGFLDNPPQTRVGDLLTCRSPARLIVLTRPPIAG